MKMQFTNEKLCTVEDKQKSPGMQLERKYTLFWILGVEDEGGEFTEVSFSRSRQKNMHLLKI